MNEVKKITYPELRGEMARHGDSLENLAVILGCKKTNAYYMLSQKYKLKMKDVSISCKHYSKTPQELFPEYFN